MPDRLEEALAEVLARIENGETVTADDLRAKYPDLWEPILDALEIGGRVAEIGAAADARLPRATKLRTMETGRYESFRLLGEGGMGLVYWALDTELNREVAFKIVRPAAGEAPGGAARGPVAASGPVAGTPAARAFETLKARFLQEAWVTAGLEHPGIVPVYEVGRTREGVPYYTMRFVRGSRTLTQAIDETRERPADERLALLDPFLRVCDTMRYAHAHGVVHRDLKPDNVALGEFGEVVVLDWGIAKLRDRPDGAAATWRHRVGEFRDAADLRTKAGALGTPGYMSPEAARGRIDDVDERSDVYSLGAVLYQLLTGRLPYDFRNHSELLHAMYDAAPLAPASLDPTVPRALSAICLRALARERDERQQSVDALATELRAWIAKRERDREIEVLEREATVATAAMADLQGDALLKQIDRVHAAATKLLDRAPESETARGLLRDAERRRELGIRQRERASHRRTMRRTLIVGLAVALVGTGSAAWIVRGQKVEARALALANASKAAEAVDPMRALLLAREAARVQMSTAVVSQLHSALVVSLEDVVFPAHEGSVSAAVFSPQGDRVVTASADHTARIWTLDGTVSVELAGHVRAVGPAVFSPDGRSVLTGSEDGTARLWDLAGTTVATLRGHTDTVNALAYSPRGDRIVTGSLDGTARLWNRHGRPLAVLAGHTQALSAVAWSPCGSRVATASQDGDVRLWDARGHALAVLPHGSAVRAIAFSPDASLLLTGAEDGWRLWDVASARPAVFRHEDRGVDSVAFSPRGGVFATTTGGSARLSDLRGALVAELLGHTSEIWSVTFSPDGEMVATAGSWDGTARVWDTHGLCVAVLRGHAGSVGSVWFSPGFTPDRGRLLTASGDGTARTWRLKGAEIQTYRSVKWGMHAMAVCGCGERQVLVTPPEGPAVLQDEDGKKLCEYGELNDSLVSARFSRDADRVVTADRNGWVRVFDIDGKPVPGFRAHDRTCSADFSPDGSRILTWSFDGTAKLWDNAGRPLRTFDEHEDRVLSAAFSPDGRRIVTGSWDCRARIWDVETGALLVTLTGHGDAVTSVVFSRSGDRVLTAGRGDQTARIWDLEGHEVRQLLHASAASVAAFSLDDSLIAVGCSDGSTWLWDAASGRAEAQLPGHGAGVIAVEFDKDGRLATACQDGNVRIRCTNAQDALAIVDGRITREFTRAEIRQYLALLGGEYDALLAAYDYVEPRLASAVVARDVADGVRADATLGDDVREAALRVLSHRRDDQNKVREKTWEVVRQRGHSRAEYVAAVGWATIADDLEHQNSGIRLVLGVAQHRIGDEAAALRTLAELDRKLGDDPSGRHLACVAALALVHHALGDDGSARDDFARLDRLSDCRTEPVPFAYRVFLEEARALQRELAAGN